MSDKTTRLTAPNGSTVVVASEKAERLLGAGYKKATTKATASKSSSAKSDN